MARAIVIGVTGGIGMGKSVVTAQLARLGAKTLSSDAIAHKLMDKGGAAVAAIAKAFPKAVKDGAVDRKALAEIVFKDEAKLKALEDILHPLIFREEKRFLLRESRKGARIVAFDIPLLFETGGQSRCDISLVASAPEFLRRGRVLARPGMTAEKLMRIVGLQMPEREKRRLADAVISTGLGRAQSFRQAALLMRVLCAAK